jgi:hypothetical protein
VAGGGMMSKHKLLEISYTILCSLASVSYFSQFAYAQNEHGAALVRQCPAPGDWGCGCRLKIKAIHCSKSQKDCLLDLFSEAVSAPLCLAMDGRNISLPEIKSNPPDTDYYKTVEYRNKNISVSIKYGRAPSTCTKPKDEGCEYRDVSAKVSIKIKNGAMRNYSGLGACGC